METGDEDSFVVAAILWIAQTILENLFAGDKLDEWIRKAGLAGDTEELKSVVERAEAVAAAVKGMAAENTPLARSLGRLRELLYDADDMVDKLDYYRLQHQVEGGMFEQEDADGHGAEQVDGNGKDQEATCKHCDQVIKCRTVNGSSVLNNHLKSASCKRKRAASDEAPEPSSAGESAPNRATISTHDSGSRTRMRIYDVSANTHAWNKAKFCNRIQEITYQLQQTISEVQKLYVSESVASMNICQNTVGDPCRRTSSLVQRKMYGRDSEKNSIIKHITRGGSDDVTILPIVGIGGIGKTALAQLIYNDPIVKSQFDHRIWIWVSSNFDEMRLTMEILDFVSQEKCVGISSLARLHEILVTHVTPKKTLLVLDDVWDDIADWRWNKLLAPWKSANSKGNVIIVTTRKLSIAKKIGTVESIRLDNMENDDFWLLFKTCAFGDENYKENISLNITGQQIAKKLQGNPLAAQTVGMLLREHLTTDHWRNVLKNEKWKSLQLYGGIMQTLKLSYDELPYYLKQCFLYCSIFPNNHWFLSGELVSIWISQGFVKCGHPVMRLEEIGWSYLTDLVNLGFLQLVETQGDTSCNQTCYVISALMHDFARQVSRTFCATIDGLNYAKLPPTIRHLSIATDSVCCEDHDGNIRCNEKFEQKLRSAAISGRKLRTLVLIGKYDSSCIQSFIDILRKAHYLRMLHISATYTDLNSFLCNLKSSIHLRYLKLENNGSDEAFPIPLTKFYHLQVLDVGRLAIVSGMNALVNMRHLVVKKGGSSATDVNEMSNHQGVQNFTEHNSSCIEITQLQSMKKLAELGVFQLENVSRAEACGVRLREKQQLERLHLSWKDTLPQDEYAGDEFSESEDESLPEVNTDTSSEPSSVYMEPVERSSPINDSSNNLISAHSLGTELQNERPPVDEADGPLFESSSVYLETLESSQANDGNCNHIAEYFADKARDVFEGLEPHRNLKHLRVSGYSGTTSPAWLGTSVINLQTLHLEDCGEWKKLPYLGRLQFLRKLELRNMDSVTEVSIPSLEELVLIKLPKLERCLCNFISDLNSRLMVLTIKRCSVLKAFPLFESYQELQDDQKAWLPRLNKLTMYRCPHLMVPNPLPPSSKVCELDIARVSTLPTMKGSTNGKLMIGNTEYERGSFVDWYSYGLTELDDNILSFHNLRTIAHLQISCCQSLSSISLEGFRQLISLKSLEIECCNDLFSSDLLPEHDLGNIAYSNFIAFPSLKHLRVDSCGITGMWLSLMLRHAPELEELKLSYCHQISGLLIEGKESSSSSTHTSTPCFSSAGNLDDALTSSTPNRLLCIPSNLISTLKNISVTDFEELTFQGNKQGLSGLTSLENLTVRRCPKLIPSLLHEYENSDERNGILLLPSSLGELNIDNCPETWQPFFPEDYNFLKRLTIGESPNLKLLDLRSCIALEELSVNSSQSLDAIEDFESLTDLRYLRVYRCPAFRPCLEHLLRQRYELLPRLESLVLDDYSFLTTSIFKCLTSLQCLEFLFVWEEVTRLPDEEKRALQLLTSLQELIIYGCVDLPVGLHRLPSLKRLKIMNCSSISRLPEKGLPPSLEELEIQFGNEQLINRCINLATSMLKVKIDGKYVN